MLTPTPENIAQTRERLERDLHAIVNDHGFPFGSPYRKCLCGERPAGCPNYWKCREALVAFERAEAAYDRMASCCAQPEQIGWCHKSPNPCGNCVANDEAEATLAAIIEEVLSAAPK